MINQICISRLDKMGDMILSLPVIKAIKMANPNVKIMILASHQNAKVLKDLNYIDNTIIIKTNSNISTLFEEIINLRKIKFDYFLNFSPTLLSYFFCFFSNSKNKATLIFLSRYKKNFITKLFKQLIISTFCRYKNTIDRYARLKKNINIHQTDMLFDLIDICNIPNKRSTTIEISLPKTKVKILPLNKKLVTIHLSSKWINNYYSEENFLNLISNLPLEKNFYVLTTDDLTKKKFIKIYNKYPIIDNKQLALVKKLENNITILNRLNYQNWVQIIYSSTQVVTPECGCSHMSSACNIPVNIIYDKDNLPEAIYKEYHPWKSKHKKLVFGDTNLNNKIIEILT